MHILVTGGAGFLGSHLCKLLIDQGHKVICVDNMMTGSKDNVADLLEDPNFKLVEHDIIERLEVEGSLDRIYNLACPASPPQYIKDPVHTMMTSVGGILNMLELAKEKGARILQASTSEVYGNPDKHPQDESYWGNVNCFGPRSCYDEGKRAAETLMHDFKEHHGVDIRIIRIFNTYGPNMHPEDGRVISNFVMAALRNEPIPIYEDGTQTRSFCFVSDLIKGMNMLMESDVDTPVNMGNPGEFTILEVAKKIIEKVGSSSELKHIYKDEEDAYSKKNDPKTRCPDITKAKGIGWGPTVDFDTGLGPTIEYYKGKLNL